MLNYAIQARRLNNLPLLIYRRIINVFRLFTRLHSRLRTLFAAGIPGQVRDDGVPSSLRA